MATGANHARIMRGDGAIVLRMGSPAVLQPDLFQSTHMCSLSRAHEQEKRGADPVHWRPAPCLRAVFHL